MIVRASEESYDESPTRRRGRELSFLHYRLSHQESRGNYHSLSREFYLIASRTKGMIAFFASRFQQGKNRYVKVTFPNFPYLFQSFTSHLDFLSALIHVVTISSQFPPLLCNQDHFGLYFCSIFLYIDTPSSFLSLNFFPLPLTPASPTALGLLSLPCEPVSHTQGPAAPLPHSHTQRKRPECALCWRGGGCHRSRRLALSPL